MHPDENPLFEKFGSRCLVMPIEEREKETAILTAIIRKGTGDTVPRASANGDLEMVSTTAVSVVPSTGSPKHEMDQQQGEVETTPLSSTRGADGAVVARLEHLEDKLNKTIDDAIE
mmetsp:Transcript_13156/g.31220  ORF Transcript_13156/g.31220 Transcript_13156/m.31220 type:complete len:116 (+) Transcript_13156:1366-1713(+)